MYFPAASLVAGQAAGFYPVVFSSNTAGVAYNNVYVPAAGTYPTWPASLTAFSGAVPGGSNATGADVTVFAIAIPAGILGNYGRVVSRYSIETNNSASTKTCRIKLDGTNMALGNSTTSITLAGSHIFGNIGSESLQRGQGSLISATSTATTTGATINTTASTTLTFTCQLATAATDLVGFNFADVFLEVAQ
jgi:hypothetical protein